MEFLSLNRRRSFARNVSSGKERGETDVKKERKKKKKQTYNISKRAIYRKYAKALTRCMEIDIFYWTV